jgi:predicted nucleic acid-binding protein
MAAINRIYLDTNIFIMAFEGREKPGGLLLQLLETSKNFSQPIFFTSQLTLSELLVVPYRNADDGVIETYESLMATSNWLHVAPVQIPILRFAAVLRAKYAGLKLPDAIHLATGVGLGCSHILTADLGLKGQYQLSLTLRGLTTNADMLAVLRPDEPTLLSLIKSISS